LADLLSLQFRSLGIYPLATLLEKTMFGTFIVSVIFLVSTAILGLYLLNLFFSFIFKVFGYESWVSPKSTETKKVKESNLMKDVIPKKAATSKNSRTENTKVKPFDSVTSCSILSQFDEIDYSGYESPPFTDSTRWDAILDGRTIRTLESDLKDKEAPKSSPESKDTETTFNAFSDLKPA
jgi:hypothetical protein